MRAMAGPVHRAWGDLKANLGGGDHTLLATAEQGEDAAEKEYEEALKSDKLPALLSRRRRHYWKAAEFPSGKQGYFLGVDCH